MHAHDATWAVFNGPNYQPSACKPSTVSESTEAASNAYFRLAGGYRNLPVGRSPGYFAEQAALVPSQNEVLGYRTVIIWEVLVRHARRPRSAPLMGAGRPLLEAAREREFSELR